jgi:hypothetical protein
MLCECHVTQCYHPTCEPLLIGGDGSADDEGMGLSNNDANTNDQDGKRQGRMMGWQIVGIDRRDDWDNDNEEQFRQQHNDNKCRTTMNAGRDNNANKHGE